MCAWLSIVEKKVNRISLYSKTNMNNRCTSTKISVTNAVSRNAWIECRLRNAHRRLVTVFVADYYSFIYLFGECVSIQPLSCWHVRWVAFKRQTHTQKVWYLYVLCGVCFMSANLIYWLWDSEYERNLPMRKRDATIRNKIPEKCSKKRRAKKMNPHQDVLWREKLKRNWGFFLSRNTLSKRLPWFPMFIHDFCV